MMLLDRTSMGTPILINMADIMKKSTYVLVRVGMGSQALSICCLKDYRAPISYSSDSKALMPPSLELSFFMIID